MPGGKPRKTGLLLWAVLVLGVSAAAAWWLRGRLQKPDENDNPAWRHLPLGERVFRRHCARCHGDEGKGDGPDSVGLNPQPAAFTSGQLKRGDSSSAIRGVILNGFPPVMPAQRTLNEEELKAVIAHVRGLVRPGALRQTGFEPVAEPRPVPPLDLTTLDGKPVTPASLRGKAVLLYLWTSTSASCLAELPELARLASGPDLRGARVLAVCVDAPDPAMVKRLSGDAAGVVCLNPDGQARKLLDVQASPTLVLIDREGLLIARAVGLHPSKQPGFTALLRSVAEP